VGIIRQKRNTEIIEKIKAGSVVEETLAHTKGWKGRRRGKLEL
jgi:hypothetical protein